MYFRPPGRAHQSRDWDEKLEKPFAPSRITQILGPIKNGTLQVLKSNDVRIVTRIYLYGSHISDTIKNANNSNKCYKSSITAQNYRDKVTAVIATKKSILQRPALYIALFLVASPEEAGSYARDVAQAFIGSTTLFERAVHILPSAEVNLSSKMVLKLGKHL